MPDKIPGAFDLLISQNPPSSIGALAGPIKRSRSSSGRPSLPKAGLSSVDFESEIGNDEDDSLILGNGNFHLTVRLTLTFRRPSKAQGRDS